ncbi:15-hydroxyprostaglandin dehydrogenase [NAD(+)]-like [Haemaphysalis longicornis]
MPEMEFLRGKVGLVTGAASGLGKEVARLLLEKGCMVSLLDLNANSGEEVASQLNILHGSGRCRFFKCDVTKEKELEECFIATRYVFGGLDIVVNSAGVVAWPDSWKVFAVNAEAVYSSTLLAFKYMGRDCGYNGGHVVNVSSAVAIYTRSNVPAYIASKYAVLGLTRSFGSDFYFNRHGVRVNCFCPGGTRTPLLENFLDSVRESEGPVIDDFAPVNRPMEPSEVAQGVVKLLQDEPNGATLICLPEIGLKYFEQPLRPTA